MTMHRQAPPNMRAPIAMKRRTLLGVMALLTFCATAGHHRAQADKKRQRSPSDQPDNDAVRAARERGDILPLDEILLDVRAKFPGELVKVEIETLNGVWVYEFKIVTPQGRRLEIYVNARTKEIVKIEGK
jgi:uncharacterized membrane protein YkoI